MIRLTAAAFSPGFPNGGRRDGKLVIRLEAERTGLAVWYAISEYILGVKPDYDALVIDPCIPKSLKRFTVTRRFRGGEYVLAVTNRRGVGHGVESVTMDGVVLADNRIPVKPGRHCVEVVL